jgi:hypothetical protein
MHSPSRRRLFSLCATAFSLCLSSCSVFEPGGPPAAITVKAHSTFQVQDVLERVFIDEGYKPITRMLEGITFERDATKTDRVLYGNWNDEQVTQRVHVTITPAKQEEHYRLRCLPTVVRDAHDVSFEDEHRRIQIRSPYLARVLREVRKQCDELWDSRTPTETGAPAPSN